MFKFFYAAKMFLPLCLRSYLYWVAPKYNICICPPQNIKNRKIILVGLPWELKDTIFVRVCVREEGNLNQPKCWMTNIIICVLYNFFIKSNIDLCSLPVFSLLTDTTEHGRNQDVKRFAGDGMALPGCMYACGEDTACQLKCTQHTK